jgi:hypothetical protein
VVSFESQLFFVRQEIFINSLKKKPFLYILFLTYPNVAIILLQDKKNIIFKQVKSLNNPFPKKIISPFRKRFIFFREIIKGENFNS